MQALRRLALAAISAVIPVVLAACYGSPHRDDSNYAPPHDDFGSATGAADDGSQVAPEAAPAER